MSNAKFVWNEGKNMAVFKILIEIIEFLDRDYLAFRGLSDKLYQKNNEFALILVELFAKFHFVIKWNQLPTQIIFLYIFIYIIS